MDYRDLLLLTRKAASRLHAFRRAMRSTVAGARFLRGLLAVGPDAGEMLSTYIVEVGEPLATFVDEGDPVVD